MAELSERIRKAAERIRFHEGPTFEDQIVLDFVAQELEVLAGELEWDEAIRREQEDMRES